MKHLGHLHYFLGIEIQRNKAGFFLSQTKYTLELLSLANVLGAKPVASLASAHDNSLNSQGHPLPDPFAYLCLVGALQYLTLTRPDIAFAVNRVCQFMHAPTISHMMAVKRIMSFLKGTLEFGLHLRPGPLTLIAFCDADWAENPIDRRSITGHCVYFGHSPVSWCLKKQATIARSSTKSEYCCLAHTATALSWLCMLLRDLCIRLPTTPLVWCDNISVIALASNPVFHSKTKHIKIDYHYVHEQVLHNYLDVVHFYKGSSR